MSVTNLNNSVVHAFIDTLQSKDALNVFAKSLAKEKLIDTSPHLGSDDLKTVLKSNFEEQNKDIAIRGNENTNIADMKMRLTNAVNASSTGLKQIYDERSTKVTFTFCAKFLLFIVAAILMLYAAVKLFGEQNDKQLAFTTTLVGLVLGFFGKTVSKMHKEEDDKLKIIETDMRKLAKLETFFAMIDSIRDDAALKQAYNKLIAQMNV